MPILLAIVWVGRTICIPVQYDTDGCAGNIELETKYETK